MGTKNLIQFLKFAYFSLFNLEIFRFDGTSQMGCKGVANLLLPQIVANIKQEKKNCNCKKYLPLEVALRVK